METITIIEQHVCVPFTALDDDVQEKVMEEHSDWNVDYDWWEFTYDWFEEYCRDEYGVSVDLSETYFSGFYSQCDGASFSGQVVDIQKFLQATKATRQHTNPQTYHKVIQYMFNETGLIMYTHRAPSHYSTQHCEIETNGVNPHVYYVRQKAAYEHTEQALNWIDGQWEDICTDLAHKLFTTLLKEYESLTSIESLSETFDAQDCVFDINTGELFYRQDAQQDA